MKNNRHGGDLEAIEKIYGIKKEHIIDFSSNVNPLGVAESVKNEIIRNIELVCVYPDVRYERLRQAIARYTGADSENIVVGNGSTELISMFIKLVSPKRAVIISPAYSEYQREVSLCGGESVLFELKEREDFRLDAEELKKSLDDVQLLVMCNPNNPTGSAVSGNMLSDIFSYCKDRGIFVMVDETYAEFTENEDIFSIPLTKKYSNVFVIRGTSKFFACPGLRLGYCVCSDKDIIERINTMKDPWSVNSTAEIAGSVMFDDKRYIALTKMLIFEERRKFKRELSPILKLYNSEADFMLARLEGKITASEVFDELIKKNIVIRDASDFSYLGSDYIRFCILKPEQNDLLISELKRILGEERK